MVCLASTEYYEISYKITPQFALLNAEKIM